MSSIVSSNNNTARIRACSLYRSILRAHKKYLPYEMKTLGDKYVQSEFRLHKSAKPEQVHKFFMEWENYVQQVTLTGRGQELTRSGLIDNNHNTQDSQQQRSTLNNQQLVSDGDNGNVFQFGKDLPSDIELNEDQIKQLQKLREEAIKAASSK